jgi:hypothetical protein
MIDAGRGGGVDGRSLGPSGVLTDWNGGPVASTNHGLCRRMHNFARRRWYLQRLWVSGTIMSCDPADLEDADSHDLPKTIAIIN